MYGRNDDRIPSKEYKVRQYFASYSYALILETIIKKEIIPALGKILGERQIDINLKELQYELLDRLLPLISRDLVSEVDEKIEESEKFYNAYSSEDKKLLERISAILNDPNQNTTPHRDKLGHWFYASIPEEVKNHFIAMDARDFVVSYLASQMLKPDDRMPLKDAEKLSENLLGRAAIEPLRMVSKASKQKRSSN